MKKKIPKRERKSFFKKNYILGWDYLKESRKFIYGVAILFAFFILIGVFIPTPPEIEQRLLELIRELLEKTSGMSQGELTSFIFFNNLQSSFLGMIFGVVFGIYSVFTTVANGYLLGFVLAKAIETGGVFVVWRLLPHGIFELPALFISMGLGLKLGTFVFHKKRFKTLKIFFWDSIRVFIFIVLPLLFVAAIIEGGLIALTG